jgi:hypothetical protein
MSIDASGIAWDITLPLPVNVAPLDRRRPPSIDTEVQNPAPVLIEPPARLSGFRFLVVEDEPLLSLELVAGLEGAGAEVVGPAGTLEEALQLVETAAIDARCSTETCTASRSTRSPPRWRAATSRSSL